MTTADSQVATLERRIPGRGMTLAGPALVGLLAAAHAASDVPYAAVSALLPTIQARFGLTEAMLSLIVATFLFGASVTQPLFGALADRVGARMVGAAGVLANAFLLSLVGVAPTVWLVFGLVLSGGLASAALHPAFTGLARRSAGTRASLAVSVFSAAGTLGVALGPVLVLAIMSSAGLGGTPLLMLPGLVLGLAAWLLVPDQPSRSREHRAFIDLQLVAGPVGGLTLATVLLFVPVVAFGAAIGIWLVAEQGVARDAPLIGWTLSAFSLAAAAGGIVAGALAPRVSARLAVGGSLVAALVPLYALFLVEVGSVAWFAAVMLAGALLNAPMPIMVVTAQNLVPRSMAAASGMLHGLAHGVAGILYIGVGALQGVLGIGAALALTFALPGVAALVAVVVLTRIARSPTQPTAECTCRVCRCTMPVSCACVA